jgi:lipopolysaccharide/colanic/teichoic acid biosynthesis glycosyltransferase
VSITAACERRNDASHTDHKDRHEQVFIRTLDLAIAILGIAFLLPLFVSVALVLAFQNGPILIGHRRIGLGGHSFKCLKFRSMVIDADERLARLLREDHVARDEWARNHKLRNDPRVTRVGRFLRRSSLDELPQLFNVLKGEMSIVGPRPIVEAEIARYGRRIAKYYSVKPGITGIWQVSGRNDVAYRTRVAMDCLYARSVRPSLYLWLVVATIPAVLSRRGSC